MSSPEISTTPAFNKTKYGNIPLLTYINYEARKDTMFHVLCAVDADDIITGGEKEPAPIDLDYKDYKKRASKAASIISLSCSPESGHTSKAYRHLGKCGRPYRRDSTQLPHPSAERASSASSEQRAPKKTNKSMPIL